MHLFRLNHHGDGDGDKAIWASPVFPSWFLPFYYTSATVCIVCSFLLLFDPISSLHAKDLSSPSEKVIAFLSSVLNYFLYCHSCHPRLFLLSIPGSPASSSLHVAQVAQQYKRDDAAAVPVPQGKWAQEGEPCSATASSGTPEKNLTAGLKVPSLCWVRLEFSQNQVVIFCRGRKGHVLHTWTQPLKFHLFTAEHKDTRILWRTVMRGLSKQTNGVCLHKPVLKNFLLLMLSKTVSWSTVVLQHF